MHRHQHCHTYLNRHFQNMVLWTCVIAESYDLWIILYFNNPSKLVANRGRGVFGHRSKTILRKVPMIATQYRSFAGAGHKKYFLFFSKEKRFGYSIYHTFSLAKYQYKSFHAFVKYIFFYFYIAKPIVFLRWENVKMLALC